MRRLPQLPNIPWTDSQSLRLDFVRSPYQVHWIGALAVVVGTIVLSAAIWRHERWQQNVEDKREEIAELTRKVSDEPPPEARADTPEKQQEARRAVAVADQLTLPWDKLFADLEKAKDHSISLVQIQPEPSRRRVRLVIEARQLTDVLAYISRLDDTASFHATLLANHELDAQRGVRAVIVAEWRR